MVCSNATVTHEKDGSITVSLPHQIDLIISSLQCSLQHSHLCDVTIALNGQYFHAHKFLLVAVSDFFHRYFVSPSIKSEVDISFLKNVSKASFELFLQFAYTSKLKLKSLEDVKGILKLSQELGAAAVKEACQEYMWGKLTGDNCTEILSFAEEFRLVDLEKQAKKLMNKRLIELSETYMKQNQHKLTRKKKEDVAAQEDIEVDVDDSFENSSLNADKQHPAQSPKNSKSKVIPSNARPGSKLQVETKAALKRFPILRPRRSRKPAVPIQIIHEEDETQSQEVKPPDNPAVKNGVAKTSTTNSKTCKMCGKNFTSLKELREHCSKEHVRCVKCRRLFTSRTHLRNHMVFHNKKGVKRLSVKKNYDCSYCGKKCNYASALKVHLRTHTGHKPFECSFCNQKFTQSINLYRHVLSYHEPNAPKYQCKICGKEFNVQIYLKSHEITHSEERPFQCEECGALFKRKNDLRSHRRVHSSEKPHQCELCMTCFKTVGDLKTHMQIHNNSKPHQCEQCPKTFKRTGHLNRHMKIHTNEKPFKCETCNTSFNRKENLRNHMRTHTGEYPYKCEECNTQFKHSSSLKAHVKKHWSHTPANTEVYVVQASPFDQPEETPQPLSTYFQTSTKTPSLLTLQNQEPLTMDTTNPELPSATTQANLANFAGTKFLCLQNYHPTKSNPSTSQTLIPISEIGMFSEAGEAGMAATNGTGGIHGLPLQLYTMPKQDGNGMEGNTLQAVIVNSQTPGDFILNK